jgi:hypothetical protein
MRSPILAITCAGLLLGAPQASAQWVDKFDSYDPAIKLTLQSNWEMWTGSSGVDADVVTTYSLTPSNGLLITGQPTFGMNGNDVVYDFVNLGGGQPTSGTYVAYARVYVPTGSTGVGWFIMLNSYPSPLNWSVQVQFNANTDVVHANEPTGLGDLTLVRDQWMPLVTCIDLDNDRVDIFYGTDLLCKNQPWIVNGSQQIACIDLYGGEPAGGISELYYENVSLERVKDGGPLALVSDPAPVPDGTNIALNISGPTHQNGTAALILTSPIYSVLAIVPLNSNGEFSLAGTLPSGLSGLQLGFMAMAAPQGGGQLAQSNTEIVVIQ